MYSKVGLYKRTITKMEDQLGRSPTINEIANEMDLSISEVAKLHKLSEDTVSINVMIGDEKEKELGNFLASEETIEEEVISKKMMAGLEKGRGKKKCQYCKQYMNILEIILKNKLMQC